MCVCGSVAHSERLLSVYLQCVFELEEHDEVEAAGVFVQSLEPLSFELALQWCVRALIDWVCNSVHREG